MEYSQPWDGSDVGHAALRAPYSGDEWDELFEVFFGSLDDWGVIPAIDNELIIAVVGANLVSMDTGAAIVRGKYYRNTTFINTIAVPSATAGNWREDCICLRTNWTAKTVTVQRHVNTNENQVWNDDDLTQVHGTTWEIPLGAARVTDAGVVTVTDIRRFLKNTMTELLLGAGDFQGFTGEGNSADWEDGNITWLFDPGDSEWIAKWWLIPSHVRGDLVELELRWYGVTTPGNGGDVRWQLQFEAWPCDSVLDVGYPTGPTDYSWHARTVTVVLEKEIECADMNNLAEIDWAGTLGSAAAFFKAYAGNVIRIRLFRDHDYLDDYADDAGFVGLRMRVG